MPGDSRSSQKIRDPVHGLIVFELSNETDRLAWDLIQTSEFQRLRRIKQLGVSEFVFPGATHTRFSHCIGVFHTARKLLQIIERELKKDSKPFDKGRAQIAALAALVHDLGHGPLSHVFEVVQRSRKVSKKHEKWSAEIVRNREGGVWKSLEANGYGALAENIATLLESENPSDIYHAVVSSSFDADRLDYLQRDRLMTGTGAGAIDFDWLLEHVRVKEVALDASDADFDDPPVKAPTFCLAEKALPAAEQFLLSRYTLHEQVYFHKTTRCIEHMIAKLLKLVAGCSQNTASAARQTGLPIGHPLLDFFSDNGATLSNYLRLDDGVLLSSFEFMRTAKDPKISDLARRLRDRRLYGTLDLRYFGPNTGTQDGRGRSIEKLIDDGLFEGDVIKDNDAGLSAYKEVGGDEEKAHKKMRIIDSTGTVKEITERSKLVASLPVNSWRRFYFENEADRTKAKKKKQNGER